MAATLQLTIFTTISFFCTIATASLSSLASLTLPPPPPPPPLPPQPSPSPPQSSPSSQPPSEFQVSLQSQPPCTHSYILSALGFQQLSTAAAAAAAFSNITTPITIFAPTDSSLLTCPSCSIPLLLREHTVPRLYPLHLLRTFAFATKIQTLSPNRCLSLTATTTTTETTTIFINGAEVTRPDLFNSANIIVHGLQGFVSHLSTVSCNLEHMTTLSFTPPTSSSAFYLMPLMLKDALLRLRSSGFSVLALAMREKYTELLNLRSLTVFALDDVSIFTGGPNYVTDLKLHIVPNRRLMAADLENLPANSVLPTMEPGENLVVTTGGGGDPLTPMRINYVKIKSCDIVFNSRIAVHGLSMPFNRISHSPAPEPDLCQVERSGSPFERNCEVGEMVDPVDPDSGTVSTVKDEDQYGL